MTFKALRTIDYAEKFHTRIVTHPKNTFVIAVNHEHLPTILNPKCPRAKKWEKEDPGQIAGYYRGRNIDVAQIVADIDAVDNYVPAKFREIMA